MDVSNYISYETASQFIVMNLKKSQWHFVKWLKKTKFESLLNTTIKLKDKNLVFVNKSNEIVNLAGIIGGKIFLQLKYKICDSRMRIF